MKALVLSDTHIRTGEQFVDLTRLIAPYLDDVDVIMHAGDSVTMFVVDSLKELKPTYMVAGNMDALDVAYYLQSKLIVDFGGFRVGITHGWGTPAGLPDRIFDFFATSDVDAIIFGHSHQPYLNKRDGILLLNPGSPTDKRFAERNTVAILEAGKELTARMVEL